MSGEKQVRDAKTAALPVAKKKKPEVNPDIPLTASSITAVQKLVAQNNARTQPRKRLRVKEFLHEAFYTLGLATVKEESSTADIIALFHEMVENHYIIPKNTALAKVFYAWLEAGRVDDGMDLLKLLIVSKDRVPAAAFNASFDEKVATVTLRLVTSPGERAHPLSPQEKRDLIHIILQLVPQGELKRRTFTPVLTHAHAQGDWPLAAEVLDMAVARGIELWDVDYNELLGTVEVTSKEDGAPVTAPGMELGSAVTLSRLERVLTNMAEHHPVVGAENAALVERIAGGARECSVSESGVCSRCGQTLHSFDLSTEDRAVLLTDIEEKLVLPRVEGLSRYEPEKKVTEEERTKRIKEFDEFKAALRDLPYDTVIDGANVGYYGLSSWYAEAKREELLAELHTTQSSSSASAVSSPAETESCLAASLPAKVLASIPAHPPFPVDVAPKFSLIESMRQAAMRQGKRPLIILHARHTMKGTPENMQLLPTWRREQALLTSPTFLNDDYCWLYAAIVRPNTFIISNDQMRDHHFLMLSPRFFVRWRQRHRITYRAFYTEVNRSVMLNIRMPRCYSVWVQRAAAAGARHWHVPYVASIPIIDQATNRTTTTSADVDLSKDGDDNCSAWVCTSQSAAAFAR